MKFIKIASLIFGLSFAPISEVISEGSGLLIAQFLGVNHRTLAAARKDILSPVLKRAADEADPEGVAIMAIRKEIAEGQNKVCSDNGRSSCVFYINQAVFAYSIHDTYKVSKLLNLDKLFNEPGFTARLSLVQIQDLLGLQGGDFHIYFMDSDIGRPDSEHMRYIVCEDCKLIPNFKLPKLFYQLSLFSEEMLEILKKYDPSKGYCTYEEMQDHLKLFKARVDQVECNTIDLFLGSDH